LLKTHPPRALGNRCPTLPNHWATVAQILGNRCPIIGQPLPNLAQAMGSHCPSIGQPCPTLPNHLATVAQVLGNRCPIIGQPLPKYWATVARLLGKLGQWLFNAWARLGKVAECQCLGRGFPKTEAEGPRLSLRDASRYDTRVRLRGGPKCLRHNPAITLDCERKNLRHNPAITRDCDL
jgi:hypothetical protein